MRTQRCRRVCRQCRRQQSPASTESSHANEFLAYVHGGELPAGAIPAHKDEVELAEDEPSAERVDTYSRDFVISVLRQMDPFRFEHFVAGLHTAMGYRASPTVAVGDGGVDVIASRDPLNLEPPIIKVQCKRMITTIGGPDIQKLVGRLPMVVPSLVCSSHSVRTRLMRFTSSGHDRIFAS